MDEKSTQNIKRTPLRFKSKPVHIEAMQWTGKNFDDIYSWLQDKNGVAPVKLAHSDKSILSLDTSGFRGVLCPVNHQLKIGDWITRDERCEIIGFCQNGTFKKVYEPAE